MEPRSDGLAGATAPRIASVQAKISDIRISDCVELTRHNREMLFGRCIDVHKDCISFPDKIECFLTLLAFYRVSVSQFNSDPKAAGHFQHAFELIEFRFSPRNG